MVVEHLQWGDWELNFKSHLIDLNLNSCMWLLATILDKAGIHIISGKITTILGGNLRKGEIF